MEQKQNLAQKITAAACGIALAVSLFNLLPTQPLTSAYAVDLPTWDDVQNAKANEAAGAAKVKEIEALLNQVSAELEQLQVAAEQAAVAAEKAQAEFEAADLRHIALVEQAHNSKQEADAAAYSAASVVSQMYRSGGVDRNLELFLDSDAEKADALLGKLSMMSKATERTTAVSELAKQAANTATALGQQAEEAANERQRLYSDAEQKMQQAAQAVEDTRVKQQKAEENRSVLEAQLAALKDKTTQTVSGYQERLRVEAEQRRRAEEERRRQAAAEAEAARKRAEAAAAAANSGGSSAGSAGGGSAPASNGSWSAPLAGGSYSITCHYGCYYNHQGLDMGAAVWTPIYAAAAGQVTWAGWNSGGYGNLVMIDHGGGVQTRYAHMVAAPIVSYGQWVGAGQVIGYVGNTGRSYGDHLHYETRVWGTAQNPYNFMRDRGVWL